LSRCTLEFSGEVVAVADGGPFDAEYLLFDPGDIELSASGPGTIRETGYRTTAGEALTRLTQLGLTRELNEETTAALRPWIARTYARGVAVRRIVDWLDAGELFDGGAYDPASGRYAGRWLDLPALVRALAGNVDPMRCATLIQAMHLAAALAERPRDEPLALVTSEFTAQRRPGERTFKRISLGQPRALLLALGALKPTGEREGSEIDPGRQEIVVWLRERMPHAADAAKARLLAIESALGAREPPARGPLADTEIWTVETKLSLGETDGVVERIESIEARRGRLPGTTYLRARAALMARTEDPAVLAQRVSALSTSMGEFHELQLLAAQAWEAAGDVRRAHAFARDLVDNTSASDSLRILAREIVDATGHGPTTPIAVPTIPKPPLAPSRTELRIPFSDPAAPPEDERSRAVSATADMPLAAYEIEQGLQRSRSVPPKRELDAEAVEMLGLPAGSQDDPQPHDDLPQTPPAARLFCTYLARELGRELRMRYGLELRTDVDGLEMAQRYLRERITNEQARTAEEQRELMRLGAFLSELLARRLEAHWIDLESSDHNRWAMLVPSRLSAGEGRQACRVWPFGRVSRFVALRHKERDLVSYYLQLELQTR
jgi:hypothetical protein